MNSFLFIVFYSFLHHCQQPDGVQYRSRRSRLYHWKGERTLFRSAATRKKYSVGTIFSAISKHYDAVLGQRSWSACMFCVCVASVVRNSLRKSLPVFHLLYISIEYDQMFMKKDFFACTFSTFFYTAQIPWKQHIWRDISE